MQTINFIYPEDSDIMYHIDTYPDSQKHLILDTELDHREDVTIYTRLSNLDDLWILLQVGDICQRHGVKIEDLYISYLFAARTDRIFSFNEALDVDIVKDCIKKLQVKHTIIFECHSDRILEGCVYTPDVPYIQQRLFIPLELMTNPVNCVLFPDKGALERYCGISRYSLQRNVFLKIN